MSIDNNLRKILPIKYPIATTYTQHAHLLSILGTHEETVPWVISNYIQIYINENYIKHRWSDFYFPMPYETRPFDSCKWIITQKVSESLIEQKWDSIISFIIDAINLDNYVHMMIDYYYVPQSRAYMKSKLNHDVLIYGYDANEKILHCADFLFTSPSYQFESIYFSDFENAYCNYTIDSGSDYLKNLVYLYKFNSNCDYEFDERNILNSICQYYYRKVPEYWSIYNSKNGDDIVFGMDFYKVLIEYIKICVGDLYVDGRPFYLLYDHKRLMQYRMEYLANNGVHKNLYKKLSEDYKDLVEQAETLQLFVQKYKVAKRDTLASKIINCLQSMEMKEVEILKPLVDLCNYGDIL